MSEISEQTGSKAQETAGPRPEAFHILVADDEDDVRQALCELLQADGYRVTGASSGREALQVLEKTSTWLSPI